MSSINTAVVTSPLVSSPTLNDFANFHGMLCGPSVAQKCIDTIDGGILFMPHTYTPEMLPYYETAPEALTLWNYYLMVIISLTGLSSLLGWTEFCTSKEYMTNTTDSTNKDKHMTRIHPKSTTIVSESDHLLALDPTVWSYLVDKTSSSGFTLERRFEYKFAFGGVSVLMLHVRDDNNKLYLVEMYRLENFIGRHLFAAIDAVMRQIVLLVTGASKDETKKEL